MANPRHEQVVMRDEDGRMLPLDPPRWHGQPTAAEQLLLAELDGPVLDVGCGPGRMVEGLGRMGIVALGVDPSPGAVSLTRRRGCAVLQRSVFEPLPGEGRWGSVLLLDGNLGIGGDPVRLMRRCRTLVSPTGVVVAEVERPGSGLLTCRARLERAGRVGAWFDWSVVGADAITSLAPVAGLSVRSIKCWGSDRWFAYLSLPGEQAACA
jgi:SAM-dependent methyltransferase